MRLLQPGFLPNQRRPNSMPFVPFRTPVPRRRHVRARPVPQRLVPTLVRVDCVPSLRGRVVPRRGGPNELQKLSCWIVLHRRSPGRDGLSARNLLPGQLDSSHELEHRVPGGGRQQRARGDGRHRRVGVRRRILLLRRGRHGMRHRPLLSSRIIVTVSMHAGLLQQRNCPV